MVIHMNAIINEDLLKEVPVLYVIYYVENKLEFKIIHASSAYWKYQDENGVISDLLSETVRHPLDVVNQLTTIEIPFIKPLLRFGFSKKPDSYSVRYWPDIYTGITELYEKEHLYLTVQNNAVGIPSQYEGYVIQVHGIWEGGTASYEFHLTRGGV